MSGVRVPSAPLLAQSLETSVSVTCRRLAEPHFSKAQNGSDRFKYFLEVRIMLRLVHATAKNGKHRGAGRAVVAINGREHILGSRLSGECPWS